METTKPDVAGHSIQSIVWKCEECGDVFNEWGKKEKHEETTRHKVKKVE